MLVQTIYTIYDGVGVFSFLENFKEVRLHEMRIVIKH